MAGEHSEGILGMMTEKLAPLLNFDIAARSQGDNLPVSRIVLHRLLTTDLDEVIHYGHRYDHMGSIQLFANNFFLNPLVQEKLVRRV
jgi:hypothetical protein